MISIVTRFSAVCITYIILFVSHLSAQSEVANERKGEFYFSWGYNTEWYTNSNINISQPSFGNNYTFENVKGHDHRGWDGEFFQEQLTIPQYNYRIGFFLDNDKDVAFELNFDHTKFIFVQGQTAHIKGTLNNRAIDSTFLFLTPNGFTYVLNNGANFFLFNIVKRFHVVKPKGVKKPFKLDVLAKGGVGPVIPHVQNTLFGNFNTPHFQLGGWDTGVELAIRATLFKYAYIEYANKLDYARYSGLEVYYGTAKQSFGTYEMILSLGMTFPMGKVKSNEGKQGN